MPRPKRIQAPNLTYHVMSRCLESRNLMNDDLKNLLIIAVKRSQHKYNYELINYTIMDNHFHLIIRTIENGTPISRIIQYIKARLAEMYNKAAQRNGPFWNERFKDIIIEKQIKPYRYFFWLMWYIGFNPVRAKKVNSLENYHYSAINCYLHENHTSPLQITLHHLFMQLGSSFKERAQKFREWENAYLKRYAIPFETAPIL